jgi:hypothetical protein
MNRRILSEKNLVVLLFVLVLILFSVAQEDSKKIEKMYQETFQVEYHEKPVVGDTESKESSVSNFPIEY